MFWRVSGFAQPSPVEAILDRPNRTLEDLLGEDDLIQVQIPESQRKRAWQWTNVSPMTCGDQVILLHRGSQSRTSHANGQIHDVDGLRRVMLLHLRLQEVKSLNSRVLEFLTKPESVSGLVRHLVAPPPPDADQQQQLRQPFAACEVHVHLLGEDSDHCGRAPSCCIC